MRESGTCQIASPKNTTAKNIPRAKALEILKKQLRPVPPTQTSVTDCSAQVAAKTLYSGISLPEYDRSAMDGFAVLSSDTENASAKEPAILKFSGEIRPSGHTPLKNTRGNAVRLLTGELFLRVRMRLFLLKESLSVKMTLR